MNTILNRLLSALGALVTQLLTPRMLAKIIVHCTETLVKRSEWKWDDELLEQIKQEWSINDEV